MDDRETGPIEDRASITTATPVCHTSAVVILGYN
jgi:hypothetical protein